MADLEGSHTDEIDAPVERVFEIASDIARAPEWQGTMESAEVLERDPDGRALLVRTRLDSTVTQHEMTLRFDYREPDRITWERESGDLKSLRGGWRLEDLGDGRTRATYSLEIGLPRALGLLARGVRGPARDRVERLLTHQPVQGLKERAEAPGG